VSCRGFVYAFIPPCVLGYWLFHGARAIFYITDSAGSAAAQPGHVGGKSLGPPMAIVRLAG